jgi:hypothetical protein
LEAFPTAALAAASHDSLLEPTSSMILYTLSAISLSFLPRHFGARSTGQAARVTAIALAAGEGKPASAGALGRAPLPRAADRARLG